MSVSIITITLNSAASLEATMKSVLDQSLESELEYLIVDGGSSDETLEIAKSFKDSRIRIISEPDSGIADAMNKGIRLASNKWIGILHSDDRYVGEAIKTSIQLAENEKKRWSYGQIEYLDSHSGQPLYVAGQAYSLKELKKFMLIPHPSVFCQKSLYEELGAFQVKYRLAMDYDLVLRFGLSEPPAYVGKVIAQMKLGGASSRNLRAELKVATEVFEIKKDLLTGHTLRAWNYRNWTWLKSLARKLLEKLHVPTKIQQKLRAIFNPNFKSIPK